jgi:hypothetical protein
MNKLCIFNVCQGFPIFSSIFSKAMFSGPLPSFCQCRVFPLGPFQLPVVDDDIDDEKNFQ